MQTNQTKLLDGLISIYLKSLILIEFGVFGGGSWATALVKILTDNKLLVNWYIKRSLQAQAIEKTGYNPDYLNLVSLDTRYIRTLSNIQQTAQRSKALLFAVPSAQLPTLLDHFESDWITDKIVISTIKGTVGPYYDIPTDVIATYFSVDHQQQAILAGPCHAEEVGLGKKTYLTIASPNAEIQELLSACFNTNYMHVQSCHDIRGVSYAAIYKNVVGIVCGMAKGLRYGDNFIAVLVANALHEMSNMLQSIGSVQPILNSSYAGDLLVTAYSEHSRNRTFGELIGRGYSVEKAKRSMQMVAEGYGATQGLYQTVQQLPADFPILQAAYRVLFKHMPASTEFKLLEQKLK
ncbi:NAD(P)H-dependent glycerol-3-phosphate dehydrogenase [Olivibacter ginsenosidimutans]|uniref:Glycerol-3-phosphate dehydrogenase n=1 Tax=Olivibacter ginsenosidimutans TaxID=1176537 RepID=A0ABP9AVI9_9SPHI